MPAVTRSMKSRKMTSFSCHAEDARSVFLAGSFNEWNPLSTPMSKRNSGDWSTDLELAPGVYEYRFVVDGEWCGEPECANHESCPNCVPNPFGSKNQKFQVDR